MRSLNLLITLNAALSSALLADVSASDPCQTGYTLCSHTDATTAQVPNLLDPALQSLFGELIDSSLPPAFRKRELIIRAASSLCCISSLTCLTLSTLFLPFCYDRFTTNFFLPDGSYGTVSSGAFSSSSGATANLITGAFTFPNGTLGNLYAENPAAAPNLATLALPVPFTAVGVGLAIPASILGVPIASQSQTAASSSPALSLSVAPFQSSISTTSVSAATQFLFAANMISLPASCNAMSTYTVVTVVTFTSTVTRTRPSTILFRNSTRISSATHSAENRLWGAYNSTLTASSCPCTEGPDNTPYAICTTPHSTSSQPSTNPTAAETCDTHSPTPHHPSNPLLNFSPASTTNAASPPALFKNEASISGASAAVALAMVFVTGVALYIS